MYDRKANQFLSIYLDSSEFRFTIFDITKFKPALAEKNTVQLNDLESKLLTEDKKKEEVNIIQQLMLGISSNDMSDDGA